MVADHARQLEAVTTELYTIIEAILTDHEFNPTTQGTHSVLVKVEECLPQSMSRLLVQSLQDNLRANGTDCSRREYDSLWQRTLNILHVLSLDQACTLLEALQPIRATQEALYAELKPRKSKAPLHDHGSASWPVATDHVTTRSMSTPAEQPKPKTLYDL